MLQLVRCWFRAFLCCFLGGTDVTAIANRISIAAPEKWKRSHADGGYCGIRFGVCAAFTKIEKGAPVNLNSPFNKVFFQLISSIFLFPHELRAIWINIEQQLSVHCKARNCTLFSHMVSDSGA